MPLSFSNGRKFNVKIVIAIVLLVLATTFIIVKVYSLKTGLRMSEHYSEPAPIQQPTEIKQAMEFSHGQQACKALTPGIGEMADPHANVMAYAYLKTGRVLSSPSTPDECHIIMDPPKNARDAVMHAHSCHPTSDLFKDNPMIQSVEWSGSPGSGYTTATGKCVIRFNRDERTAANLEKFWKSVGNSHCETYFAAIYNEFLEYMHKWNTLQQEHIAKLDILATLTSDFSRLNATLTQCNARVKSKVEDYHMQNTAHAACSADHRTDSAAFVKLQADCANQTRMNDQRITQLHDLLTKQRNLLEDQEQALARLRERLEGIVRDLTKALEEKANVDKLLEDALKTLQELQEHVARLTQENARLNQSLKQCRNDTEEATAQLEAYRGALIQCQNTLQTCEDDLLPKERTAEEESSQAVSMKTIAIQVLKDEIAKLSAKLKECKDKLISCKATDQRLIDEIEDLKKRVRLCEGQQYDQSVQQKERLIDIDAAMAAQQTQTISDVKSAYCKRPTQSVAEASSSYQPYRIDRP